MSISTAPAEVPAGQSRADASETAPPGRRKIPRRIAFRRWISPVALIAVWQVVSGTGLLPPDKLAAPYVILQSAWDLTVSGKLPTNLLISLSRVSVGVLIGIVLGLAAGLLAGLSRWGNDLLDPPVQGLRTLPHLGLVPLFILWFGIGEAPKIALVALGVTFPLYLNVHGAIRGVDPKLIEASRALGFTRSERIRHVVVPSALPGVLVGLRQGLGIAWLSLVIGEQFATQTGIGYMITDARDFLRTDVIVVGLLVYAALGLFTDFLVRLIERRALRWRVGTEVR